MKRFPKTLTKVTPFSKFLAFSLFFIFIFAALFIGMQYQKSLDSFPNPTPTPEVMHCGGFVYHPKECPPGYICKLGRVPDTGGVCIKEN